MELHSKRSYILSLGERGAQHRGHNKKKKYIDFIKIMGKMLNHKVAMLMNLLLDKTELHLK